MKVKTNGIELNYTVEGNGPWLVMSHSLACDLTMWDEQAAVRCCASTRAAIARATRPKAAVWRAGSEQNYGVQGRSRE